MADTFLQQDDNEDSYQQSLFYLSSPRPERLDDAELLLPLVSPRPAAAEGPGYHQHHQHRQQESLASGGHIAAERIGIKMNVCKDFTITFNTVLRHYYAKHHSYN